MTDHSVFYPGTTPLDVMANALQRPHDQLHAEQK